MYLSEVFIRSIFLFAVLSLAPLLAGLCVGFLVSVFQAATQIQDAIISFVPKLFFVGVVLFALGSWMTSELVTFTGTILSHVATIEDVRF